MYGSSLYDRPRTDNTVGHARRALDDLHIHGKFVKGGPPTRSKIEDDMQRLRSKWPRHALARIRRESLQQSITEKAQRSMLQSQLSQVRAQMPAWGGPAQHVAHRDYILGALRKLGAQNVAADSSASSSAAAPTFINMDTQTETVDPRAQETSAHERMQRIFREASSTAPSPTPAPAPEPAAASSSRVDSAAAADPDVTPTAKPRAKKPKPRAKTNIYVRP